MATGKANLAFYLAVIALVAVGFTMYKLKDTLFPPSA